MKENLRKKIDDISFKKFKNQMKIEDYKEIIHEFEKKIDELEKENRYLDSEEGSVLELLNED
jgi:peptidoglycan hydrolase CwlO-like protein